MVALLPAMLITQHVLPAPQPGWQARDFLLRSVALAARYASSWKAIPQGSNPFPVRREASAQCLLSSLRAANCARTAARQQATSCESQDDLFLPGTNNRHRKATMKRGIEQDSGY
jgi:hypothetical protein